MIVAGSPDYFKRHAAPKAPEDLAAHRCINQRVRVEGQLTCGDDHIIKSGAIDGIGLGFLMEDYTAEAIADGRLIPVLTDWCQPFSGYYLYYPNRYQPSAAFRAVVDALRYSPPESQ
jgi:DNA-binding transcriptional LysR family regulator